MADYPDLCAIVVTFHPDERVFANLRVVQAECGRVVVVDNGSSAEACTKLKTIRGLEVLELKTNRGIATALNVGARRALDERRRWIVTFDQDSTPRPAMIAALRAAAERHPQAAMLVPCILEGDGPDYRWVRPQPRVGWFFQRVACRGADLPAVTMAVSSGSMIDLQAWQRLGGFDESLFIDYVDIDFCLRVVRSGARIAVVAGAQLDHRLGAREKGVVLGHAFRPTHHAAFRHYYLARNRVHVWRRHARAVPHWALFDLCFAVYHALRVLALERDRWNKFKAMALGLRDGIARRTGPCPAERQRCFAPPQ